MCDVKEATGSGRRWFLAEEKVRAHSLEVYEENTVGEFAAA